MTYIPTYIRRRPKKKKKEKEKKKKKKERAKKKVAPSLHMSAFPHQNLSKIENNTSSQAQDRGK
jgi:hypothetical protein